MPSATSGRAVTEIDADAGLVYGLVTDITRMGERSPECYRAEWLDSAAGAVAGARFKGHNKLGPVKWVTTCEVTTAVPGKEFAFAVVDANGRVQTRWTYTIEPTTRGCVLTEKYEFVWCPLLARIAELPFPRDRQLRRGIARTVAAIKREAERAN